MERKELVPSASCRANRGVGVCVCLLRGLGGCACVGWWAELLSTGAESRLFSPVREMCSL
jgi:hypothetical protein